MNIPTIEAMLAIMADYYYICGLSHWAKRQNPRDNCYKVQNVCGPYNPTALSCGKDVSLAGHDLPRSLAKSRFTGYNATHPILLSTLSHIVKLY